MLIVWIGFLIPMIYVALSHSNSFLSIYWLIYWSIGFYFSYIKRTLKLRSIEYDDENIYVVQNGQDFVIPFSTIKEVKLASVTGLHVISLYRNAGLGKEIGFKSSLWYPFNFKKIDEEVYKLQRKIDQSRTQHYDNPSMTLPSQNS
ncbi:MAG: hypothetical protein AAGG59_00295 [Bacteroidota bacterium]